ncbi:hypothetical protein CRI94_04240 [Longibacter salinarum]|uniref:Uncharacterized protein n=1 Tax=Longibacter salinarum TaxID=1850348 RepID=A0A2A8D040_9BACT|nr:hypothetical protein [Longibacter salinarum]PEN14254.1 hypothetical protein CRI94_04240 [Longibacter salinarum]
MYSIIQDPDRRTARLTIFPSHHPFARTIAITQVDLHGVTREDGSDIRKLSQDVEDERCRFNRYMRSLTVD